MNHSMTSGDAEVLRQIAHKPKSEMRATLAIQLRDRMDGGRYAPPHDFKEDYREPIRVCCIINICSAYTGLAIQYCNILQGQPELSYFNINTPKMWPIRTTRKGSPPSPAKSVTGGMSALSESTGGFPRGSATMHPTYHGFGASAVKGCSKTAADSSQDDESSFLSVTSPISSVFANSKVLILSSLLTAAI